MSADGQYILYLQDPDTGETLNRPTGSAVEQVEGGEPPAEIDGYRQLNKIERLQHTAALTALRFGESPDVFSVSDRQIGKAAKFEPQYVYDEALDVMTDLQTGMEYVPVEGTFTAEDGSTLRPGWSVPLGIDNYVKLFTDPSLRQPFVQVFIWTVFFAALQRGVYLCIGTLPGHRL